MTGDYFRLYKSVAGMKNALLSVILTIGLVHVSDASVKCYSCFYAATTGATTADQIAIGSLTGIYASAYEVGTPTETSECDTNPTEALTKGGCKECGKFLATKDDLKILARVCIPDGVAKCAAASEELQGFKYSLDCCSDDKCNGANNGHLSPFLPTILLFIACFLQNHWII